VYKVRPCKMLEKIATAEDCDVPEVDAKILDGSVVVNMLLPKSCSTFGDYAEQVFLPYVLKNLQNAKRLDVVWDGYIDNSSKRSAICQQLDTNPK